MVQIGPRLSTPSRPPPAWSLCSATASTPPNTLPLHDAIPIFARPTAATASLRSPPPARAAPTPSRTGTRCYPNSIRPEINQAVVPYVAPGPHETRVLPVQQARQVPRGVRDRLGRQTPRQLRVQ